MRSNTSVTLEKIMMDRETCRKCKVLFTITATNETEPMTRQGSN